MKPWFLLKRTGVNWKMWMEPLFICGGRSPSRWFGFRLFGVGFAFRSGRVEYLSPCSRNHLFNRIRRWRHQVITNP